MDKDPTLPLQQIPETTMKYILGTKVEMTEFFDESGKVHPVTVIQSGPVYVTQIKKTEKDGYNAIQVGFGDKKEKNSKKPQMGHTKALEKSFAHFRELRFKNGALPEVNVGDIIDVSRFAPGDMVTVSGTTKGKGFQSVIKRHGFKGGPRSHGQKHSEREPGSIGGGLRNRVPKGMRMAGRMGGDTISVKGLRVISIEPETGRIMIKGALPGRRGTLLTILG
jgi:large subunit ribosomal protein L3